MREKEKRKSNPHKKREKRIRKRKGKETRNEKKEGNKCTKRWVILPKNLETRQRRKNEKPGERKREKEKKRQTPKPGNTKQNINHTNHGKTMTM